MNIKLIALVAAVVCVTPVAAWSYYVYVAPEFGWEYEDCYLDVTDANKIYLATKPTPGVFGAIVGPVWDGGDTLYKSTDTSDHELVRMYSEGADEMGEFQSEMEVVIDRKVMSVTEMDDDYIIVVFFGKTSNSDSYQLYMNGYSYDPNACLTYIVEMSTGKMFNVTKWTCSIDAVNLATFEVHDHYDSFGFLCKYGDEYIFEAGRFTHSDNLTPHMIGYFEEVDGETILHFDWVDGHFENVRDEYIYDDNGDIIGEYGHPVFIPDISTRRNLE